ncbi:MAG TPA: TolC family protein [Bryobacteraceae bacterium]|jgi:outer membrane protein TolC
MSKLMISFLALAALACAEVHSLTLRQTIELAVRQNPEVALVRLDEQKARAAIRAARDPFLPRVTAGSGLAYTSGFPMSIEGSAPSVMQAVAQQFVFNRPQSLEVARAKENARGAAIGVISKRDEVVYRAAALYLDAERAARIGALARTAIERQQAVLDSVRAQVAEGRALPIVQKQAELALARDRQAAESVDDEQAAAETDLAIALGFAAEDRVRAVAQDRPAPPLPASEQQAAEAALASNSELRQLESQIAAKQLELRGASAARLPRADLVAQYALLAKFNNYTEYFNHFQRNNGEIGVSFQVPLFVPGVRSATAQGEADLSRLKIELANARNRIVSDLADSLRSARRAQTAADVARLDLEVAREQLSVGLAQFQEGRQTMRQVDEARLAENDKWIAFYDAQYALEKARWNVLRLNGGLLDSAAKLP